MKKTFISLLLCAGIVLCMISFDAGAVRSTAEDENDASGTEMIVTLDYPSLLDYAAIDGCKVSNLLLSEKGQEYSAAIASQQEETKRLILSAVNGADLSDSVSYTAVTNAFTVNIPLSEAESVRAVRGVRSVSVCCARSGQSNTSVQSQAYDNGSKAEIAPAADKQDPAVNESEKNAPDNSRSAEETKAQDKDGQDNDEKAGEDEGTEDGQEDEPKEYDTYGMASKAVTNVRYAYERGYTGKGMLIAVIDNEFDTDHDVFSVVPEDPRYDKEYVNNISKKSGLNISAKYKIKDIF